MMKHKIFRILLAVLLLSIISIGEAKANYWIKVTAQVVDRTGKSVYGGKVMVQNEGVDQTYEAPSSVGYSEGEITSSVNITMKAQADDHYTFSGWFTNAGDANAESTANPYTRSYYTGIGPNKDTAQPYTIYAKFTPITYTITYDADGGTLSSTGNQSYNIESTDALKTATKTGYTFYGWKVDVPDGNWTSGSITSSTLNKNYGNVTLKAQWAIVDYSISFAANGGTGTGPADINYNIESTGKAFPACSYTRAGYDFSGWKPAADVGNWKTTDMYSVGQTFSQKWGNVTINAQWTPIDYTITYDTDGGTLSSAGNQSYNIESSDALKTATKTGYTFNGWKVTQVDSNEGNWTLNSTASSPLSGKYGNVTLKAQWTPKNYTITYDTDGGTLSSAGNQTYNIESTDALKTATKTGYTFNGWKVTQVNSDEGNWTLNSTAASPLSGKYGNVTLKAQWTPIDYTITYDTDGGTLSSAGNQTYNIESTSTVKSATKTDFALSGWQVTTTGGNWPAVGRTVSASESLTGKYGNVALKALWGPLEADITIQVTGLAEGETIIFTVESDEGLLFTVPVTGKASGPASVTIKDLSTGKNYYVKPDSAWGWAYNGLNSSKYFGLGTSGQTCEFTVTKKTGIKKYDQDSNVNWKQ